MEGGISKESPLFFLEALTSRTLVNAEQRRTDQDGRASEQAPRSTKLNKNKIRE